MIHFTVFARFFVFSIVTASATKSNVIEVPLSNDGTVELLQHWTNQAFSGLFAAVATRKKRDSGFLSEEFHECSKNAGDVNKHAKCVSKLLKNEFKSKEKLPKTAGVNPRPSFLTEKDQNPRNKKQNRFSTVKRIVPSENPSVSRKKSRFERLRLRSPPPKVHGTHDTLKRLNIRRNKRHVPEFSTRPFKVVSKQRYDLTDAGGGMSPFGTIAKLLKKSVLTAKNKTSETNWKVAIHRVRQISKKRKELEENLQKHDDEDATDLEKFAFRGLKHEGMDIAKLMDDPQEIKKLAQKQRKEKSGEPIRKILDLLRDGVKMGYQMTGKNVTDFDEKTVKVISPRFLSVLPEEEDDIASFLSPSLFSLHNDGKGIENLTSLPNLVKTFNGADQQQWLDFIIEAAGVEDQATKLEREMVERKSGVQKKYEERIRGENGQPMFFTKENVTQMYGDFEARKIQTWEKLMKTYTKDQLHEMNTTGYTVLDNHQLEILYGPQSPYNSSETLARLQNMTDGQLQQGIEDDVHKIAAMKSFNIRQKDIVLSPIINSPLVFAYPAMNTFIVLSPVVLSPVVGTPAVLGPVVLSPWVFVPVILSPRVLSPLVLNPLIFSPIVLSPLVLHPLILSPGVFNPIVLSPLVLSPFILSPQVFTPVILSPLVLNPLILNPMVGSPLVLSPFVLSPLIMSPQALFAVVLSPYALSPLVASPLTISEVVLSPSWLS